MAKKYTKTTSESLGVICGNHNIDVGCGGCWVCATIHSHPDREKLIIGLREENSMLLEAVHTLSSEIGKLRSAMPDLDGLTSLPCFGVEGEDTPCDGEVHARYPVGIYAGLWCDHHWKTGRYKSDRTETGTAKGKRRYGRRARP